MSRPGVDYEIVKQTAVKLLSQGIAPSVQKIREELGTGSNTTIAEHLKVWRDEYAKKTIHHLPANMLKSSSPLLKSCGKQPWSMLKINWLNIRKQ